MSTLVQLQCESCKGSSAHLVGATVSSTLCLPYFLFFFFLLFFSLAFLFCFHRLNKLLTHAHSPTQYLISAHRGSCFKNSKRCIMRYLATTILCFSSTHFTTAPFPLPFFSSSSSVVSPLHLFPFLVFFFPPFLSTSLSFTPFFSFFLFFF